MRKIALTIAHTPWIPARADSMARLKNTLGLDDGKSLPEGVVAYHEESERAPNWHWSMTQWLFGAVCASADDLVVLQDDDIAAPNFWLVLQAIMSAAPDSIIDLSAVHPAAKRVAREGRRAYTTLDGLVGNGYRVPKTVLREFLGWQRENLYHDAIEWSHEDSLINVFALCTGRRIFHPVPTIIDHDLSIRSTYGNDAHAYRSPAVTWADGDVCGWTAADLEQPGFWTSGGEPPYLGRQYAKTHWAAKRMVKGFSIAQFRAAERAKCPQPYARFFVRP